MSPFARSPFNPSQFTLQLSANVLLIIALSCADGAGTSLLGAEPEEKGKPEKHTNGLVHETSPYLLQHAHNPVNWRPWGEEALAAAKKEGKLIFLSVGYSSCHWCHVMEHESFTDEEIAAYLNKHFICIKVDREERPDVDAVYMNSLFVFNRLTRNGRGGGWPLSMFLTPEAQPFFGGTYFPARDGDRGNSRGFLSILEIVVKIWAGSPEKIREDAKLLVKNVKLDLEQTRQLDDESLDAELIDEARESLAEQYDPMHGGFGFSVRNPGQPKFPEPSNLVFLLDHAKRHNDEAALEMVVQTLHHMANGGIRDHLGGGFHRYSVDRFWKIPHFEKMLYDNGQLASVYAEAWAQTKDDSFRRVVDEMVVFLKREMTHESGAFYSALDADSEGEEGKFYRWEVAEAKAALTDKDWQLFADVYALNDEPNFEEDYYALQLSQPLAKTAADKGIAEKDLEAQLAPMRAKLLAIRDQRIRPGLDSKLLTAWNGLMIAGLADAGRIFENAEYVALAEKAADAVLEKLRTPDGRLLRTSSGGKAKLNGYLVDYAFLVDGLIALHEATGKEKWLTAADELTAKQIELFWDEKEKAFFFTSNDHESLIARAKNVTDGARPSGNSVAVDNLLYLAKHVDNADYRTKAKETINALGGIFKIAPSASPRMLTAAAKLLSDE